MNVVFRVDASIHIGSGHVMRCLTLGKQLKRHGMHVTFICRELEGNYIQFLRSADMDVVAIHEGQEIGCMPEQATFEKDGFQTIDIIETLGEVDLLIVDHYKLDVRWEKLVRPHVEKIMVIDDLANRKHDCNLLLDQNYYENFETRYDKLVPNDCERLLGPNNVLLRDEYLQIEPRTRIGMISNIFIFFGGSDPTGETLKALQAIKNIREIHIDVVVGYANPYKENIERICNAHSHITFHYQIDYMARLMNKADLAIGAGGAITWERCVLGLPSLTMTIADNQVEATKLLHNFGAIVYMGNSEDVSSKLIEYHVVKLINNPKKMRQLSEQSREIVDIKKVKKRPVVQTIVNMLGVE